jgi:hypothetical protein
MCSLPLNLRHHANNTLQGRLRLQPTSLYTTSRSSKTGRHHVLGHWSRWYVPARLYLPCALLTHTGADEWKADAGGADSWIGGGNAIDAGAGESWGAGDAAGDGGGAGDGDQTCRM